MWPIGGRSCREHCPGPASRRPRYPMARGRSAPPNVQHMSAKTTHTIGIILNGVTGRMGLNQHLRRSLDAIRADGGVALNETEFIMPNLLLVGRNPVKLEAISREFGGCHMVDRSRHRVGRPQFSIYFDAQTTDQRAEAVKKAIAAGKQIYCEKPTATTLAGALELYQLAKKAGVKHGVVQDKLWLPGLRKLETLRDMGFFGKILSVRGEFGYWVFEGDTVPAQRPSWNYRQQDGGGMILDMLCHWRYVLDHLFGEVQSVSCLGATHISSAAMKQASHTPVLPTTPVMPHSSCRMAL